MTFAFHAKRPPCLWNRRNTWLAPSSAQHVSDRLIAARLRRIVAPGAWCCQPCCLTRADEWRRIEDGGKTRVHMPPLCKRRSPTPPGRGRRQLASRRFRIAGSEEVDKADAGMPSPPNELDSSAIFTHCCLRVPVDRPRKACFSAIAPLHSGTCHWGPSSGWDRTPNGGLFTAM